MKLRTMGFRNANFRRMLREIQPGDYIEFRCADGSAGMAIVGMVPPEGEWVFLQQEDTAVNLDDILDWEPKR